MKTWDLDPLFPGFDSKEFKTTLNTIESLIEQALTFVERLKTTDDAKDKIKQYLSLNADLRHHMIRAFGFVNLTMATNALDDEANGWMNHMQQLSSKTTPFSTAFSKWLPKVENLDNLIQSDETLHEHAFYLKSIVDRAQYVLSEKEEALISKLTQTGSSAWGQLQGLLTSTLKTTFDGKTVTLTDLRNKAHHQDQKVRKQAYEAELKAYESIEQSVASALNSIKGEVNEITALRGFDSALDEAVYDSRMKRETLDALIESMRDHLPLFRQYLKRKASLLGHKNGLPWYDLFAPLGKSETTFSIEEAMDYVVKNFRSFGDDLADLAKRSYDESWIDFTPRDGKRGGAFCFNIHPLKQSRILTNFEGSFSNVITLAHELGHAYHGDRIFKESILNASYTMPVAETASTLCETIVKKAALNDAKGDEQLFILEQSLMGTTQVIVDIMSRFIFEKNVFEARKKTPLSAKRLKSMMVEAQKEAYGDGLDQENLHPYMWVNKGHYYRGSLSFYNFPYAFGLLFAKGIYAQYQKKGASFVEDIDTLLQKTGKMTVEDVAQLIGVDVTKRAFWDESLNVIKEEIDLFLSLTA